MTKYKMNNTARSSSEVTLTSFVSADSWPAGAGAAGGLAGALQKAYGCGLNELRGDNLAECLCERYGGGCKLCPRPPPPHLPAPALAPGKGCRSCGADCGPDRSIYSTTNDLYSSHPDKAGAWRRGAARRLRSCCSRKTLLRRLPVLQWLPQYSFRKGLADIIAGTTVGLTVIPQAIAYAGVAGLPPQYGLYSSFAASFAYAVLGSVRASAVGPTAIAAILTRENLHGLGPPFAVLLAFLSGCVELAMGVLQLGFLIDFISGPVSVGFTSAAAIIIATSQVKNILGLSFPGGKFLQVWAGLYEHIGETRLWDAVLGVSCIVLLLLLRVWAGLYEHIGETRLWDAVLGVSCIVLLLLLRKVKDIRVGGAEGADAESGASGEGGRGALAQALWFLSTTRNIIVVLACAALAYYFDTKQLQPFVLTGEVKPGLPPLSLPAFSATVGNHTYSFTEMASTLGSAIVVVPLLSILENIALAKVFAEGAAVDATQEMVALGVCNIVSSCVQSMPVSGALSRGAVNHASGVASPAAGLYSGALVLLALQYFTPYFYYIPKASLAAVIIAAVVFMMELHVFKPIWQTKKVDIIPGVVTFGACLLTRLELGIALGIAVNLLFLLYASARPSVKVSAAVSGGGQRYWLASVDRALAFPAAERVRRALAKPPPDRPLVIDAQHVQAADFTAAEGIKALIEDFHARGQTLIFYNVKPSIAGVLRAVRPRKLLLCSGPHQLDLMLRDATPKCPEPDLR